MKPGRSWRRESQNPRICRLVPTSLISYNILNKLKYVCRNSRARQSRFKAAAGEQAEELVKLVAVARGGRIVLPRRVAVVRTTTTSCEGFVEAL